MNDAQRLNEIIVPLADAYIDEELAHKRTRQQLEDAQTHGAVSDFAADEWKRRSDRALALARRRNLALLRWRATAFQAIDRAVLCPDCRREVYKALGVVNPIKETDQ